MSSTTPLTIARVAFGVFILVSGAAPSARGADRPAARPVDPADPGRMLVAAQRGDPRAQAAVGFMYATGDGFPQSYEVAIRWYTRSAEQGDPDGQYLLGLMYDKGLGVDSDVVLAYKWLSLAAGHAPPRNRDNFLRIRDAVASKMTPAQISLAQKLAVDFAATPRP